jgi:hypothetical protein
MLLPVTMASRSTCQIPKMYRIVAPRATLSENGNTSDISIAVLWASLPAGQPCACLHTSSSTSSGSAVGGDNFLRRSLFAIFLYGQLPSGFPFVAMTRRSPGAPSSTETWQSHATNTSNCLKKTTLFCQIHGSWSVSMDEDFTGKCRPAWTVLTAAFQRLIISRNRMM